MHKKFQYPMREWMSPFAVLPLLRASSASLSIFYRDKILLLKIAFSTCIASMLRFELIYFMSGDHSDVARLQQPNPRLWLDITNKLFHSRYDSSVLSGFLLMFIASIVWLKLVSYAHTNYDIRMLSQEDKSYSFSGLSNEEGVSFNQLAYFMFAPTLCYQQNYPRTMSIRKGWVTRQLIKWVICTGVMGFIIEQYMNPIVKQSQHPLKVNLLYAIERVLKLSVPTLYVWLCMFYGFFHLWLNILAELLLFGDREFYKDWWNAKTVEEYWRMWNMPVHKWMIRHVYFPCLRNGIPKGVSIFISFFVSAIFHELCVAVPCHIFKFWAFLGIMFQIPLVTLTKYLQRKFTNTMVGNIIFWFFFCILGQPMCVLLYYHDVMNRNLKD
ncbi:diacylglycerol O-acyltransferase 1-2-like [Zingiber officinale]|uniref:diacylglycerol O-acyltransferase 1-2-like n=1 Tax=Zingiber officinale TaxID=94328 RepID=UPI001C4D79FA|nr:diacylglycerol O-acyltransferase 1-2-like [Zingiber officinale]